MTKSSSVHINLNKVGIYVVFLVLFYIPSSLSAQAIFLNETSLSGPFNSNGHTLFRTRSPHPWYTQPGGTHGPLLWHTDFNTRKHLIENAFDNWENEAGTPYWATDQETTNINDATIRFRQGFGPGCGTSPCVTAIEYYDNPSRGIQSVSKFDIHFPTWDDTTLPDAFKETVMTHELGHVYGLADRYNGTPCGQSNPKTIMSSHNCSNWTPDGFPTDWDSDNLKNYWLGCGGSVYWCGTMQPNGNITVDSSQRVTSKWRNHAFNNYVSLMIYYVAPHWSSPSSQWTNVLTELEYDNIGFWEGATVPSTGLETTSVSQSLSSHSGKWVVVCNRPWFWYNTMGYLTCSNNAEPIP